MPNMNGRKSLKSGATWEDDMGEKIAVSISVTLPSKLTGEVVQELNSMLDRHMSDYAVLLDEFGAQGRLDLDGNVPLRDDVDSAGVPYEGDVDQDVEVEDGHPF